ncbi:hypothetical protein [Rhodoferax sp.]|uniref:hypothetical protein n=1 Tax=Rhodoferax sp. TaxID=50421 RepID=UPI00374D2262
MKTKAPRSQTGVVMVMTLICLVLMLVAAVALTRSSTNSLLLAGNFAFKRDMQNQGERGMAAAVAMLNSGSLATEATRTADQLASNYVASKLASNAQGIPLVLINETTYAATNLTLADISDSTAGVSIRVVIDRQCVAVGAFDSANCVSSTEETNGSQAGTQRLTRPNGESRPTYRISVRVTGPRNTQTFQQMVLAL